MEKTWLRSDPWFCCRRHRRRRRHSHCHSDRCHLHRAVNSILSVLHKPNELILMNLLYSNCVPILSNAADVVEFSTSELRDCNTAINDTIRRIYSYQRWESTRCLRTSLGFPSIYEIFSRRSQNFLKGNLHSRNDVIKESTSLFLSERIEEEWTFIFLFFPP